MLTAAYYVKNKILVALIYFKNNCNFELDIRKTIVEEKYSILKKTPIFNTIIQYLKCTKLILLYYREEIVF